MKNLFIIFFGVAICQLFTVTTSSESKNCQSNANMKYDLNHTH